MFPWRHRMTVYYPDDPVPIRVKIHDETTCQFIQPLTGPALLRFFWMEIIMVDAKSTPSYFSDLHFSVF